MRQNKRFWNWSALVSLKQPGQILIFVTFSHLLFGSCLRLVFANTVLTTAEAVFIVKHYFRSYRIGHAGGPSWSHKVLCSQEHFHKNSPINAVNISDVEEILRSGCNGRAIQVA